MFKTFDQKMILCLCLLGTLVFFSCNENKKAENKTKAEKSAAKQRTNDKSQQVDASKQKPAPVQAKSTTDKSADEHNHTKELATNDDHSAEDGHDHAGEQADAHAGEAPDAHAGHDHAGEQADAHVGEAPDAHAGHDHAGEQADAHAGEAPDAHAGHDHAGEQADAHAGEAPDAHAGHAHSDEINVTLSQESQKIAGLSINKVSKQNLSRTITLSGEVVFNDERVCRVVPRYAGIVVELKKMQGDYCAAGDIIAVIENNENLTKYTLKSPISGNVIEKNANIGEFVSETEPIVVIADLETVWVNLEFFDRDAPDIEKGLQVEINSIDGKQKIQSKISYIAPLFKKETRSGIARVLIPNAHGIWRPGMFVQAKITIQSPDKKNVIQKSAIQYINMKPHVFIPTKPNIFKAIPIKVGSANNQDVEVLGGLNIGDAYVAQASFELKAKFITSSLGEHAGHGH